MTTFTDFYEAFTFLEEHRIFENKYKLIEFQPSLSISVVKVNPVTKAIDSNAKKNTITNVWLECGPFERSTEYCGYVHDLDLDTGGATFEEAVVNLANLVHKKYGENPEGKEIQAVKLKELLGSEAKETRVKGKYKLSELLEGITEENRHEEIFTDRQGREKI